MTIKINSKSLQVCEEERKSIDWVYLTVTCVGYGLILWIIRLAAHTFLGGM